MKCNTIENYVGGKALKRDQEEDVQSEGNKTIFSHLSSSVHFFKGDLEYGFSRSHLIIIIIIIIIIIR
jgi:hypothetical protein